MRISHTLAVQNKVKLRVLARLLHRVDITIIIISGTRGTCYRPLKNKVKLVRSRFAVGPAVTVFYHTVYPRSEMLSRSSRYSEAQPEQAEAKCRSA